MKMLYSAIINLYRLMKLQERGATAVEYAIMASLIAGVIIASVTLLGGQVVNLFNTVVNNMP